MAKAIGFEFVSYKFERGQKKIFFNYSVTFRNASPIFFTETLVLPLNPNFEKTPKALFEKLMQCLHLALGISYYKLYCPKKIKSNYALLKEEADFWNDFYKKGLGEFFYRNNLNPKIAPKFVYDKNAKQIRWRLERNSKFMAAIGGGKDSIVSVELLKSYGADVSVFFVENQKESAFINSLMEKMSVENIKIRRILDEKIFNQQAGYYQGHVPASGIYAFLGVLTAVLSGFSNIVVSNEFSSNFGNTVYKKLPINHQWSKSSEFEILFQSYLKNFISPDLSYFSLLRPFYEIRIAELFSKYSQYFESFSSCNSNFKINGTTENPGGQLWCKKCPKCIFAFLLLSPFLKKSDLISIFGENIFLNVDILITLRDILGFGKIKPFDCVGTFDEAKAAFFLSRDKFRDDLAGEIFLPKIDPDDNRYFFNIKKVPFKIYFKGKKKPQELVEKVFRTQKSFMPDYLKFLGMKNALILGYGKEGQAAERYLQKYFPELKTSAGDINIDAEYLEKQKDYDIAIRSPGIKKELVKIPYTTPTNIFFSFIRQMSGVKIIGVTGTKGKSTTASLICHILKTGGENAKLLGNIGFPMIDEIISGPLVKNTIFVLELSSYQLDDIKYSPNVAVVTSLFADHMDYHYNIKNYYAAKKNIIKYQQREDFFVFNQKDRKARSWAKGAASKTISFADKIPVDDFKINLPGEHNKQNIRAAISVAKIFGISEPDIAKAIKTFKTLPHRLEFIGQFKGIQFYDDAISTTPESTIAAIKSFKNIGTIFLGGQDRGYSFSELEREIKKYGIKNIVLFPESGKRIFRHGRKGLNIFETSNMEEAVKFAYQNTKPGEICLLSCASPSYSLWKNFEEKGGQFQELVKKFGQ